jgi:hypothetical protein
VLVGGIAALVASVLLVQGIRKVILNVILYYLKVHKIENFFGSDFEFCVVSLLVMLKY